MFWPACPRARGSSPGTARSGAAELKAFRDMLADSASYVGKEMKAGKTLEAIKAAGLPAGLEPWAKGFMKGPQWLELVYRSLEKNAAR